MNPEVGFGDAYSSGRIEMEGDLVRSLECVCRSSPRVRNWSWRLLSKWLDWVQANTRRGSSRNIQRHYDLSNDFYRLWLDEQMVYTCAYFPTPDASLEEAQEAKLDLVCRKLGLRPVRPSSKSAAAGARWPSTWRSTTASASRPSTSRTNRSRGHATGRRRAGVASRVEFVEDDYRNVSGQFDVFVSVGMLEHVGRENYRELGRVIHRAIGDTGRGFLHFIGRNRPQPFSVWIRKRIFPGAYAPSLRESMEVLEPQNYSVLDVENLRMHYAKTLEHWLARFEASFDTVVRKHGMEFARMWRLYLAGSVAAFRAGNLQLFQVLFAGKPLPVHPVDARTSVRTVPRGVGRRTMDTCDVIIVGGGPAGSSCAWALRDSGLDVLVVDRAAFPRHKLCGGWITPLVLDELEFTPEDYSAGRTMQPITGFRLSAIGGPQVEIRSERVVSYGIRRCEFDEYLLRRSGARLREGMALTSVERVDGGWLINGEIRARMLIGAGGHFCPVGRYLGNKGSPAPVLAQEIEFEMERRTAAQSKVAGEVPELFFCRDMLGYGWVFRKDNYLNVGLGRTDSHEISRHVKDFVGYLRESARGRDSRHRYRRPRLRVGRPLGPEDPR